VDLPPEELRARLAAGKVYLPESARAAEKHFFRPGTSRRCGNWRCDLPPNMSVRTYSPTGRPRRRRSLEIRAAPAGRRERQPHVAALVRWTRRSPANSSSLAGRLCGTPQPLNADGRRASPALGAGPGAWRASPDQTDDDVARGLLRVAGEQNATQLVVGKPVGWRALDLLRGGSLLTD